MARTSTYLNFAGKAEAAFNFYRSVFGTDFPGPMQRMRDVPASAGLPPLPEAEKDLIMHVALPILGGHMLMGSDTLESLGHKLELGNNVNISLEPDTRAEAERLFQALGQGGTVTMPLADMFWGDYFGSVTDRFGVQWMVNCRAKA
jgi:PhnB protein